MSTTARIPFVLGPGIGLGLGAFVVTLAVLLLLAPPAIPYVIEAVISFVLMAFAFPVLGIAVAGYVDESRRSGPRVAVWMGVSTSCFLAVAILSLCAAASLFPVMSVLAIRLLLIIGLAASGGILGAVVLVDRLGADSRQAVIVPESSSALNLAMRALEESLSGGQAPLESVLRVRRVLERHRTAIEPMSHVATSEDPPLADAVLQAVSLLKEPGGEARQPGPLTTALRSIELCQERRIAMQVKRG